MIYYKTAPEIELMRQSARLVSQTLATIAARLRPGVTLAQARGEFDQRVSVAGFELRVDEALPVGQGVHAAAEQRRGGAQITAVQLPCVFATSLPALRAAGEAVAVARRADGEAAALPVQSFVEHFRDEFAYHIEHKTCRVPQYV